MSTASTGRCSSRAAAIARMPEPVPRSRMRRGRQGGLVRQALQRAQAAAGGAVLAGAERHPRIQHQGDAAGGCARRQVGAADREAAADALLGKARLRAGEPALDRGIPAMQGGRDAGRGGRQQQRRRQHIIVGPRLLHPLDAPGLGGFVMEEADGHAGAAQRRLVGRDGRLGHVEPDRLQAFHLGRLTCSEHLKMSGAGSR